MFKWIKNLFKSKKKPTKPYNVVSKHSTAVEKLNKLSREDNATNKMFMGCKPDLIDGRDHIKLGTAVHTIDTNSTKEFSLKQYAPKVIDQGNTSSCTGCAGAAAMYILLSKMHESMRAGDNNKESNVVLSPLYIYYNARIIDCLIKDSAYGKDSTTLLDSGATLRSLMKALKKYGVIPESMMPFDSYTPSSNIPCGIDIDKNFKIKEYLRIEPTAYVEQICKNVLMVEKLPIIVGLYLYKEQMRSLDFGGYMHPCENIDDAEMIGGHAICVTGFKTVPGEGLYFEFINSWGTRTGDFGYGYFPASFLSDPNYTMDIWTFDKSYF